MADNSNGKRYVARDHKLRKVGDSYVISLPKDKLREHGLIDEDGEPVRENIRGTPYIDSEDGVIGAEVPLDG